MANVFASVAEWEREVIAGRTKDGLQAAQEAGRAISRPALADNEDLRAQIEGLRESGMTQQAIADKLNADKVPTLEGEQCGGLRASSRSLDHLPDQAEEVD